MVAMTWNLDSARMSELIEPGGGEVVGDSPERRVEILSDHEAVHATWTRYGPHRDGADLHVHRRHSDLFYVLEGALTVRLGVEDRHVPIGPGTLVRVPPLVVHGFRNAADAELRYLNFHAPGERFADFLRSLRDGRAFAYDQEEPPEDGGRPTTEAVIGGGVPVGEGTVLLADVDEIAIAETSVASSVPHVHDRHVESLYVLEGELAVTIGDRELRASAGSWVQIPPGAAHAIAPGDASRFLEVHTPGCGFGAFLRAGGHETAFDQRPAG
jgi:mannose-6-phosphate isomerase-like protein (cupin superfamily)